MLDELRKSAVQMQFIIIGEAMTRIRADHPDAFGRIRQAERIVAFRHVIAHGYDIVADDVVWDIIHGHLGHLEEDVAVLKAQDS